MNRRRMMMQQAIDNLPKEYTRLDYIDCLDSHGSIDTGVNCADSMTFEIVALFNKGTYPAYFWGALYKVNNIYQRAHFGQPSNSNKLSIFTSPTAEIRIENDGAKHIFYMSPTECKLDEYSAVNNNIMPDLTFWLFGRNTGDQTAAMGSFYSRVYSAKFWSGDKMVRNFVPVIENDSGKYGLFDLVNKQFYTNQYLNGGFDNVT